MSSKVAELYSQVKAGQVNSLSCVVVYQGELGDYVFSGFLSEDINFNITSDYGTSMSQFGANDSSINKIKNTMETGANMFNAVLNNTDGGSQVFNPLNTRQLWNSTSPPSFSVEVNLFTLSENDNILEIAQEALLRTSPIRADARIIAPGKYSFPARDVWKGRSKNNWALKMGNHFEAYNLVCTGLSVTISKEHVRFNDPEDLGLTYETKPLYITLKFDFITDRMLFNTEVQSLIRGGSSSVSVTNSGQSLTSLVNTVANLATSRPLEVVKDVVSAGKGLATNSQRSPTVRASIATANAWNKGIG